MLIKHFKLTLFYIFVCFTYLISAEEHKIDPKSAEFWGEIVAILLLVVLSGIVAGLTLGLMSLDTTNLAILEIAGTPQQQYYASRIIPIRKNGHILLTTLLLTNTVINETLPILFDGIFSKGFISVIVSTALLVLFAEIIPQAIFSKHGLAIGALFAFPVRILIILWFIVSWPIAKFLDYLLGTHTGFVYNVPELGALVQLHDKSKHKEGTLKPETATLVQNVLDMQNQTIEQILIPTNELYMLPSDALIDITTVRQSLQNGYQHLFVCHEQSSAIISHQQIMGVIKLKSLLDLEEKAFQSSIGTLLLQSCVIMPSNTTVIEAMHQLVQPNARDQVILVYQSQQDETISVASTIKEANTINTMIQKTLMEQEEEKVIGTNNAGILLGMLTFSDILNLLSKTRYDSDDNNNNDIYQLKKIINNM